VFFPDAGMGYIIAFMEPMDGKTLYIFIDESGNFDFTENGTKYFVLTAVSTTQPLKAREQFSRLRYELMGDGMDQEYFHATEDKQVVRDAIFKTINNLDDFGIDCVLAQKNKTNPSLYLEQKLKPNKDGKGFKITPIRYEEKFYHKLSEILLQYIFRRHSGKDEIEKVVVVLGSIFTNAKRQYVLKSLKQYFKTFKKPFYIYFHGTGMDINCQIADYCGWAIYVKSERGELRPYEEIKDKIKSCFDVFGKGDTIYYGHKN
jgi:hypothetical protein